MYNHRTGKNISGFKVKDFEILQFGLCGIYFYQVMHIETKKQVNEKPFRTQKDAKKWLSEYVRQLNTKYNHTYRV